MPVKRLLKSLCLSVFSSICVYAHNCRTAKHLFMQCHIRELQDTTCLFWACAMTIILWARNKLHKKRHSFQFRVPKIRVRSPIVFVFSPNPSSSVAGASYRLQWRCQDTDRHTTTIRST
jgi:hypothetical protein